MDELSVDRWIGKLGHQRGPSQGMGRAGHGTPFTGVVEETRVLYVGWIVAACRRLGRSVPAAIAIDGRHVYIVARQLAFGPRYYFVCPECGHRRDALYFLGRRFGCRKCLHLGYRSQTTRPGSVYGWMDQVFDRRTDLWRKYRVDEELMANFVQDLRKELGQQIIDMLQRIGPAEVDRGQNGQQAEGD